jgi:hypothetical protein
MNVPPRAIFLTNAYTDQTGQASRIARSCGLDRGELLSNKLESDQGNHSSQRLWWTVCVLDQRHSAIIGANPDHQGNYHDSELLSTENVDSAINPVLRLNLLIAYELTKVMTGMKA